MTLPATGAGINSPQVNTATVNEPSASRQWQQDPANFTENKLNDVLRGLDGAVGRLLEALPINGMLILFTCQGDTAEYRRLQVRIFEYLNV